MVESQSQVRLDNNYQVVLQSAALIKHLIPDQTPFFWYDLREQQIYHSISGYYLGPWVHISEQFPKLDDIGALRAKPGTSIILLSQQSDALARANLALSQLQRTGRLIGHETIKQGNVQLYLTALKVEAAPQAVRSEQLLDFSTPRDHDAFLVSGWGAPESFGSWTDGARSDIKILRGTSIAADRDLEIVFDVPFNIVTTAAPQVSQVPPTRVDVSVNGALLDTWKLQAGTQIGERTILVPASVLARADTITITLDIHDPHSPHDLGFDDTDQRRLGIAVRSIRLVSVK